MKKIILLITLLLFVKVQAQFFEAEFGPSPETVSLDEWTGSDWNELASQVATFNSDCFVETITTFFSGLEYARSTYTYNAENQVVESISQLNNFGTWENSTRTQNTYTGDNLTEEIESIWNGSSWDNSTRIQSTYTNSNVIEEIESNWDGSGWVNSFRIQYTFSDGNIIEQVDSNWDGANWVLLSRTLSSFSGSNKLLDDLFQLRDTEGTSWENVSRTIYTYSAGDLLEQEVDEEWNSVNTTWDSSGRTAYFYTGSTISEIISYFWDGSEYLPEDRSLISYNGDDLITQFIIQEYVGTDWENITRVTFSYPACQALATDQFETFDFSFHPNPANNNLKILNLPEGHSGLEYTIFDMSGRLVQKGSLNSDFTITTQYITNGLYVLKLSVGSNSVAKQLVIKH